MPRLLRISFFMVLCASVGSVATGQQLDAPTPLPAPAQALESIAASEVAHSSDQLQPFGAVDATTTYHNGWASLFQGKLVGRAASLADSGAAQGIPGAQIALLKDAVVFSTTIADADGVFSFSDVAPGIYGITVDSEIGFGAHSFHAVAMPEPPMTMDVYVSRIPRRTVDEVLRSLWTPDAGTGAARSYLDGAPRGNNMVQTAKVSMRDGIVYGELLFETPYAVPSNHFVKVYNKSGNLIATERVDSLGKFSFAAPEAGIYSVIVGGGAFACIAVQVVGDQPVAASARSEVEVRFVNTQAEPQPIPSTLVISTIGPPASGQLPPEDFQGGFVGPGGAPAYSGGGFGGGGGGSGGGFGGGMGGLGGLLGIGGLAAGIVALADNEDGFTPIPGTPISP